MAGGGASVNIPQIVVAESSSTMTAEVPRAFGGAPETLETTAANSAVTETPTAEGDAPIPRLRLLPVN